MVRGLQPLQALTQRETNARDLNKKKTAENANALKAIKSSEITSSLSCLLSSRLVSRLMWTFHLVIEEPAGKKSQNLSVGMMQM